MDPRKSCEYITEHARHVTIETDRVDEIALSIASEMTESWTNLGEFCKSKWTHPLRPESLDESALSYIFLCGAWNYCFWPNPWEKEFGIECMDKLYMRSWGMVAAVHRAASDKRIDVFDPKWQSTASADQIGYLFWPEKSCGPVPLLEKRLASINQLGWFTLNNCKGKLSNLIRQSNGSAVKLMNEIISMSMWNDVTQFKGKEVQIMKRAQVRSNYIY